MKATPDEKGRSVRLLRIGEQVRHALAEVLLRGDLRDELLARTIVSVMLVSRLEMSGAADRVPRWIASHQAHHRRASPQAQRQRSRYA